MFTGIIKAKGSIGAIEKRGGDVRLRVTATGLPWADYAVGDSISVNGVCLTAVHLYDDGFDTDVSVETLDVTTLKHLAVGDAVNLEPALRVGDALGGHLVSGHVDGIGKLLARADDARSIRMTFAVPGELARYVAKKGSICVDGVTSPKRARSAWMVLALPSTRYRETLSVSISFRIQPKSLRWAHTKSVRL
jgi:riboflavin synthase